MFTIISIVVWILSIFGYVIYNLYTKNIKLENNVVKQSMFINNILNIFNDLDKTIDKIDHTIYVHSDQELLALFEQMKQIQSRIKEFNDNE